MAKPIVIEYCYKFRDNSTKTFTLSLDRDTLSLQVDRTPNPPVWSLLTHKQCQIALST